jgi:MFS family permease
VQLLTDITPLRENPVFRRLWIGNTLSSTGGSMASFANTLQVWNLTHSTTATGGVAVALFVPMLIIALPGGSLADRVDRRKLVLATTTAQVVIAALFVAQALLAHSAGWLWVVYALIAARSGVAAISQPARRTFIRALVAPSQLAPAMALDRISFQTILIAGPGLGGLVTGAFGVQGCYLADLVSFAGSFYGIARLPRSVAGAADDGKTRSAQHRGLPAIGAGLRFIARNKVLAGTFLADLNATFFALPLSLFPAINAQRFGGDPRILGLFTVAVGVGGMVTAVLAGPLGRTTRQGAAMLGAVAVWGAAFAVFAVSPWLWLTLLALGVAGAADSCTVIYRGIIVQRVTPDEFRGRVNAADYVVGAGGGQLGSLESGLVGSFTSPVISALLGALLTIAGTAAIGAALPAFREYADPEADGTGRSG